MLLRPLIRLIAAAAAIFSSLPPSSASAFFEELEESRGAKWETIGETRARRIGLQPGKPIVVGDSHAAMWPASGQQRTLGTSLVNLGVGNDRVSNLIYRLNRADFSKADAPYIVVLVGTNDIKIDEDPTVIVSKIVSAVTILKAKSANTPILVSEVFPWCGDPGSKNDRVGKTNELLSAQAEMHGFSVIPIFNDLYKSCRDGASQFYRDRIHLNASGYALLGRKVATSLRSNE